jgi:hypothetical protein
VIRACDQYVEGLRARGDEPGDGLDEEVLDGLVKEASRPLKQVFEQALAGQREGRLLWIPQGSLVALPIMACEVGDGGLADRAAVMTAPSLTLGLPAIEPDAAPPARGVALRGRVDASTPEPTDGGAEILSALTSGRPEVMPERIEELNEEARGASVLHLTCHGVYDWGDPLKSYLKLGAGFDLSVADLFEKVALEPDSLVLFGTCDSATVAQGAINEAIGIPIAMMAAGARGVVGSRWPVARSAAVAICLQFLRELARGAASPEALQRASSWLRTATLGQLSQELATVRHPYAAKIESALSMNPGLRHKPFFHSPHLWASYVHWGGGWRVGA